MKEFFTLFRLELKSRFGTKGTGKPALTVLKIIAAVVLIGLVYAAYVYGVRELVAMFWLYGMSTEFLVLFIALSQLILVVFGISSVIKNLFRSGDNELLMRFPVSAGAVFASKISILVMYQVIFTIVVELPVFIIFGLVTKQTWTYYVLMPVVMIFIIALPLAIGTA